MAAFKDRIDRLDMLAKLIPTRRADDDCPDAKALLGFLSEAYDPNATLSARLRTIQRDLRSLVEEQRIEEVNPGGKPLRYRRIADEADSDPRLWDYARQLMMSLIREALPERRLERVWARLREEGDEFGLGDDKLRILGDSQRLVPADVREEVLLAVLEALSLSRSLQAGYRDREGKMTRPLLHPQALLQRGPRLYLFALKNDEDEPVRMYALHRFTSAQLGESASRPAEGFSLDAAIRDGQVDFSDNGGVQVELRVRGYVEELLRDCPLATDQQIEDEPDGSPFAARVRATVTDSGQLLRWVLGCGDNVEVLGPDKLRRVVAGQLAKAAALYGNGGES